MILKLKTVIDNCARDTVELWVDLNCPCKRNLNGELLRWTIPC